MYTFHSIRGSHTVRRLALSLAVVGLCATALSPAHAKEDPYKDPVQHALPAADMQLDLSHTALVIIDPQIDFMSPKGKAWGVVGESVTEQHLVPHLVQLLQASKKAGIVVAISPHYYYPHDHKWQFQAPAEKLQHDLGMFDRKDALTLDGFRDSGADFMPEFKPFIEDGKTIVASPHKLYGPQANDLSLQLRKQHIDKIILTGMASNLCVESHLREFLEQGFEVAVVRDAIAGPKVPEGDGYGSALVNFRFIANGLWTTDQTIARLEAGK